VPRVKGLGLTRTPHLYSGGGGRSGGRRRRRRRRSGGRGGGCGAVSARAALRCCDLRLEVRDGLLGRDVGGVESQTNLNTKWMGSRG